MTLPSARTPAHRSPAAALSGTALVIGGGGSTGNAWALGVIAGLADAGFDATRADLTVGTSSGATAAAQITSGSTAADLYAAVLAEARDLGRVRVTGPGKPATDQDHARVGAAADRMAATSALIAAATDAADMRRRIGAAALEAAAAHDATDRWRAIVAARLPGVAWPQQRLLITAVDAATGEPVVLDRDSGVELVDAVAASTSSGSAYAIGDRWYVDGGYRRNENADLAAGCARVLVLSPFGGRSRHPREWRMDLAAQVEELTAGGSSVVTVVPTDDLTGARAMDLSLRPAAARSGYAQGGALAPDLTARWQWA
jgi:NTE family protein